MVFGLDIGTRSIVGTVGYRDGERFIVKAECAKEHETRAMLDGQIHDIRKVGSTIKEVKETLEKELGFPLKDVCIAAAGRVLRTVTIHVETAFEEDRTVERDDMYVLSAKGVEQAYEEFSKDNHTGLKFFCVGYSVIRYYMNGYQILNPEEHKAGNIGADMIVTFLPEDVVDGLYKAVELAGLTAVNLTLEPIAAIQVAIPEKFRMLNIALVDVGAGTSDISITKDGAIVAYGMIPIAGDSLTEAIARHCLVDFNAAEEIKRQIEDKEEISFTDIMGLPQTISSKELLEVLEPQIEAMTKPVAECIMELNGDKPVSAVFVVGGGGKIPGYTKKLSEELGIVKERVAVRGGDVMGFVDFPEYVQKDSLLVTPVGICLSYYEQHNNIIYVTFNEENIKIYDNGKLSVVDAAMQADFPNEGLFPRRGAELDFTVDGKKRIRRGQPGESAIIMVNGMPADIHTPIKANDVIVIMPSTAGEAAKLKIGALPEYRQSLTIRVNDKEVMLPKFAMVNGEMQSEFYDIKNGDKIEMQAYYTVEQVKELLDLSLDGKRVLLNNAPASLSDKVYENFSLQIADAGEYENVSPQIADAGDVPETWEALPDETAESTGESQTGEDEISEKNVTEQSEQSAETQAGGGNTAPAAAQADTVEQSKADGTADLAEKTPADGIADEAAEQPEEEPAPEPVIHDVHVVVNGSPITLHGKASYVYVDVFDYIDFDLKHPRGSGIETLLNGQSAEYLKEIFDGDVIDIRWKD
ncbi:MAG: cell division protein FtsA [Lachnospiraceae bacterium]|nr:cell division protein FtsA [Lachnospiraceae bacterium]